MTAAPAPVEYLHAIQTGRYDGNDDWHEAHVIAFPIIRKTPKRIYYDASQWATRAHVRFVDRQRIETDGEVWQRNRHWSAPDFRLHLAPPVIEQGAKPDLAELKTAMAAAHPGRGGSDEALIAARRRYENALSREAS